MATVFCVSFMSAPSKIFPLGRLWDDASCFLVGVVPTTDCGHALIFLNFLTS